MRRGSQRCANALRTEAIELSKRSHMFPAAQGGALVNLIHGYADNGDPFVRKFTDQLLEEVTRTRLRIHEKTHPHCRYPDRSSPLCTGGFSLESCTTRSQSFSSPQTPSLHICNTCTFPPVPAASSLAMAGSVLTERTSRGEHESGLKLWESKYRFHKEMLPSFVGEVFGNKVRS